MKSLEPVNKYALAFSWWSFSLLVVHLSSVAKKRTVGFSTVAKLFSRPFIFSFHAHLKVGNWFRCVVWLPSFCLPSACAFLPLHLLAASGTNAYFLAYQMKSAWWGMTGYCYGPTLVRHVLSLFTCSSVSSSLFWVEGLAQGWAKCLLSMAFPRLCSSSICCCLRVRGGSWHWACT